MSTKQKQILVAVLLFLTLNAVFISVAYIIRSQFNNENATASENIEVLNDNINPPKIVNQNPSVAYVGSRYSFFPKIMDSDTEVSEIVVTLKTSANWLKYQNGELYGYPAFEDIGTVKVNLELFDGFNRQEVVYYILVEAAE